MTKAERDKLDTLIEAIQEEKTPDSPVWQEQVRTMRRIREQISDHVDAITALIEDNQTVCALFHLALTLELRTGLNTDITVVLGNSVEVKRALLDLVTRVNQGDGLESNED